MSDILAISFTSIPSTLSLCSASCCLFILVPISLYYLKRLCNLRQNMIISKRLWKPLVLQILCTILLLSIGRPLALLLAINFIEYNTYTNMFSILFNTIFLHINLYLILMRYWILHYDICYRQAQTKQYWQGLKSVSFNSCSNFYLNYRSTLGNLSYLRCIIILLVICTILISYASYIIPYIFYKDELLSDMLFFATDSCILFIPTISGILIIWVKTPTITDNNDLFGIKHEMKIILYATVFGFIFHVLCDSIDSMIFINEYKSLISIINITITCVIYFCINIYPLIYLFHFSPQSILLKKHNMSSIINETSKWSLTMILSSQIGLDAFMKHLIRIYSDEHILAICEMIQYTNFYANKTEKQIEELEKDYNQKYKPIKIKCSFIGSQDALRKMQKKLKSRKKSFDMTIFNRAQNLEKHFRKNGLIKNRVYNFRNYENCFVGREVVPMVIKFKLMNENNNTVCNNNEFSGVTLTNKSQHEENALDFMNELMDNGIIEHVLKQHRFENEYFFYHFTAKYNKYKMRESSNMKSLLSSITMSIGNRNNRARSLSCAKDPSGYKGIKLPESLLKSSIVFNPTNCMKHKIVLLCKKYIVPDCLLEVNISSQVRENLLKKKDNIMHLNTNECKHIFDAALAEIYRLIHGAFPGFRGLRTEYTEMKEQMQIAEYFASVRGVVVQNTDAMLTEKQSNVTINKLNNVWNQTNSIELGTMPSNTPKTPLMTIPSTSAIGEFKIETNNEKPYDNIINVDDYKSLNTPVNKNGIVSLDIPINDTPKLDVVRESSSNSNGLFQKLGSKLSLSKKIDLSKLQLSNPILNDTDMKLPNMAQLQDNQSVPVPKTCKSGDICLSKSVNKYDMNNSEFVYNSACEDDEQNEKNKNLSLMDYSTV